MYIDSVCKHCMQLFNLCSKRISESPAISNEQKTKKAAKTHENIHIKYPPHEMLHN